MAKKNSKLDEAVAIFKELGWEKADWSNLLDLPLGTPEQRKIALEGLKTGDFSETLYVQDPKINYARLAQENNFTDVNKDFLGLYAILIGVNGKRAYDLLIKDFGSRKVDGNTIFKVVETRDEKFIKEFIEIDTRNIDIGFFDYVSTFADVVIQLIYKHNLEIPKTSSYLCSWSVYMASIMGLENGYTRGIVPSYDMMVERFVEHIKACFEVNLIPGNSFGKVVVKGVNDGLIDRKLVIELIFTALDNVARPVDRKTWLEILETLEITDEELVENVEGLIPVLSIGDNIIVNSLAPRVIKYVSDDVLINVLIACFSVTTLKAKLLVLNSAIKRPCPNNTENILPWINILVADKDSKVSSKASELLSKWNIKNDEVSEETEETEEVSETQGLWRVTPKLWDVPKFELGEVSQVALTELVSELVNRRGEVDDIVSEKLLAMANILAYKDKEECKMSFVGIGAEVYIDMVRNLQVSLTGEVTHKYYSPNTIKVRAMTGSPLEARNAVVAMNIDKIPCILSTPSKVDLSISLKDLVDRLKLYKEKNQSVLEADLVLALTRLDLNTKTEEDIKIIESMDLPIELVYGQKLEVTTSKAILYYLENPITDENFINDDFSSFNETISKRLFVELKHKFSIFPNLGDCTLEDVYWESETYNEKGLILRQIARRSKPLPTKAAINILAAQRSSSKYAVEDATLSVVEAWERGLLIPKVANLEFIDWQVGTLSNIAALASAFDWIIREGILSVVWWILDDIIKASLKAPRLLAGTVEILQLIDDYLPEVLVAIEKDIIDNSALELQGVRELASSKGSSKAVTIAKKIVKNLPEVEVKEIKQEIKQENSLLVMEKPFEEVWITQENKQPVVLDGAKISAEFIPITATRDVLLFNIKLSEKQDKIYKIAEPWLNNIMKTNELSAFEFDKSENVELEKPSDLIDYHFKKLVCLYFETDKDYIQVSKESNTTSYGVKNVQTKFSMLTLTVIIGLLAEDGTTRYDAPMLVTQLIESGDITDEVVRNATKMLLESPELSPVKLVRIIEKNNKLLPIFYTMLIECIKKAGEIDTETGKLPVWVNRVLDITLRNIAYLVEAEKRGLINLKEMLSGAEQISCSKAKSSAVDKAKKLCGVLK